jgi:hypothetical protein
MIACLSLGVRGGGGLAKQWQNLLAKFEGWGLVVSSGRTPWLHYWQLLPVLHPTAHREE